MFCKGGVVMAWRIFCRGLLVAFACVFLCGCAEFTTKKYKAKMDAWVGRPLAQLIEKQGKPARSYFAANGSSVVEYDSSISVRHPEKTDTVTTTKETPVNNPYGVPGVQYYEKKTTTTTTVKPAETLTYWCKTRFISNTQGIIVDVSFVGNNCVSDD